MEQHKPGAGHSGNVIAHEAHEQKIAALAYKRWQDRGCPEGSPEVDWFRAVEELRSGH